MVKHTWHVLLFIEKTFISFAIIWILIEILLNLTLIVAMLVYIPLNWLEYFPALPAASALQAQIAYLGV